VSSALLKNGKINFIGLPFRIFLIDTGSAWEIGFGRRDGFAPTGQDCYVFILVTDPLPRWGKER